MKATKREPAYRLTSDDAVEVWLMHWAGELNHRIAAHFDTNQGRVSEVLNGRLHPSSEAAARVVCNQSRSANTTAPPSRS